MSVLCRHLRSHSPRQSFPWFPPCSWSHPIVPRPFFIFETLQKKFWKLKHMFLKSQKRFFIFLKKYDKKIVQFDVLLLAREDGETLFWFFFEKSKKRFEKSFCTFQKHFVTFLTLKKKIFFKKWNLLLLSRAVRFSHLHAHDVEEFRAGELVFFLKMFLKSVCTVLKTKKRCFERFKKAFGQCFATFCFSKFYHHQIFRRHWSWPCTFGDPSEWAWCRGRSWQPQVF